MIDLENIQAVLFDLDGTLVDVEMNFFVSYYLRRLTEQMKEHAKPKNAIRVFHQSVAAMFANTDAGKTLEDILLERLQSELEISPERYAACLDHFCLNDLETMRPLISGHPLAPRLIEASRDRGWQVVLATNPIFPRAVIDARLSWGGLDGDRFHHVMAYETAHFCKPSPRFFEEILNLLQFPAENCLMIGNDPWHDLSASQVGMQTCLLTPWSIKRSEARFAADWEGGHEELLVLLQTG
jgi:FMN phosphatase YigB (HAD superfamily)